MIYLLTGENAYQVRQECNTIIGDSAVYRIDGDTITENILTDVLMGSSLFATPEVIVLTGVSDNKTVWEKLGEWIARADSTKTIIIIESNLDKRTRTYKALKKYTTHISAERWTDRQRGLAREWVQKTAKHVGVILTASQVDDMIDRALVPTDKPGTAYIDQMRLYTTMCSLSALDAVTDDSIDAVMPKATTENVFTLLEKAVNQDSKAVSKLLYELRTREDAHQVFGLVVSQWFSLVALAKAGGDDISVKLGMHPYVAGKMTILSKQLSPTQLHEYTHLCAHIDIGIKLSEIDPWNGIERFLMGLALRNLA
ncbi:hypothetical protein EOL96_04215 [Candidatus Saccharibacteria bacterium]|nr:hypothetical protein [Candidatus Saccharibacteria bacterium]